MVEVVLTLTFPTVFENVSKISPMPEIPIYDPIYMKFDTA